MSVQAVARPSMKISPMQIRASLMQTVLAYCWGDDIPFDSVEV
jgi:hypothetical protein